MKTHWLVLLVAVASWLCCAPAASVGDPPRKSSSADATDPGFLLLRKASEVQTVAYRATTYQPQPGDILLYHMSKFDTVFRLAGSGTPMHAAIVFARPDGTPASLEMTGPQFWLATVKLLDVGPRLRSCTEAVMVRQLRTPLTAVQSAALTRFALAQEGKDFALGRLFLQSTPFKCRTGLRRLLFGHTYLDRSRWICSELVVAAAASAGLFDVDAFPANAMYPRDLAYDETYDLSAVYNPPILWAPQPDAVPDSTRGWRYPD